MGYLIWNFILLFGNIIFKGFVPTFHIPPPFFYAFFTSIGKAGTHISLVVGHVIRNQCVYRPHEYFIDNSGEIECVRSFKIWLPRCNSKTIWNNFIKFIWTKALRYGPSASHWSRLIRSFEYWTKPRTNWMILKEWGWGGFGQVTAQLTDPWWLFSSLMAVALSIESTSSMKENILSEC